MKQRILTGLILAPLAIAFVLLSPTSLFAAVLVAVWLVAAWEWAILAGLSSAPARIAVLVVTAACLAGLWLGRGQWAWWAAIVIGAAWWLLAVLWMRHFSFAAAPTPGNRLLKLGAGSVTLLPAWVALIEIHGQGERGPYWALFALMLVWAADTFAYFSGSRFGRTKLAPRISPGKTREGVWGAMAGTIVVAIVGGYWLGQRGVALWLLVGLAVICVVYSILGDLFESLLKRQASLKDSGSLFPGHGGMLDRLDGVFAAMPAFVVGSHLIDLLLAP